MNVKNFTKKEIEIMAEQLECNNLLKDKRTDLVIVKNYAKKNKKRFFAFGILHSAAAILGFAASIFPFFERRFYNRWTIFISRITSSNSFNTKLCFC